MTHARYLVLPFALILLILSWFTHAEEKLTIHMVLNNSDSGMVHYVPLGFREKSFNTAFWAGFFTGGIGGLIAGGALDAELEKENERLTNIFKSNYGTNEERRDIFTNTLTNALASSYNNIEFVFHPLFLDEEGELDTANAAYQNLGYLLYVKETSGLATPVTEANWGKLGGYTLLELKAFDVKSKSLILHETMDTNGDLSSDVEGIVASKERFLSSYENAVKAISNMFYWRLTGRNYFHTLAANTPLNDQFPSIQQFFEEAANSFKFKQVKFKKWRRPNTNNKFMFIAEPKKHNKYFAIVTEIDFLAEELGQNFDSAEAYVSTYLSRLKNMGWNTEVMETHEYFNFNPQWITFTLNAPAGGIQVFAVTKQEDVIILHKVVILENIDTYIDKYAKSVVSYVHDSKLVIKD